MSRFFRFGAVSVLPLEGQVLVDGVPVKLGARAFDLLLALIERHGQTVSRRELPDIVWSGRVVEDQNLQVQVVALRKLLGSNAIATIPGRGYRFALPLDERPATVVADDGSNAPTSAPTPIADEPRRRARELSGLFGRTADALQVRQLLSAHRFVTIAGAGGIGKTRLAQAVAAQEKNRYADGVYVIELASLADADAVPLTVARALGLSGDRAQATADGLAQALRPLSLLILLDNCEHLLEAAGRLITALLTDTGGVHVLATSQEPLKLADEKVYRLRPLPVAAPLPAGDIADGGAVELFVARAQAADHRFALSRKNSDAVIDVCEQLDGIPLAIELAAARVPLLGVDGLRERLHQRLRLLTAANKSVPQRQQTLRNALQWSHALLNDDEQLAFRRLGVFVGSFSLLRPRRWSPMATSTSGPRSICSVR